MSSSSQNKKIFIVIPAFNEERVICSVLDEVRAAGFENIIVVDDGSCDGTHRVVEKSGEAIALKHFINRGKGGAIKTGIEAAKILGADVVITMDGDGQHNPGDIPRMITLLNEGCDVVLGSRLKNPKGMPAYKILHNTIGNFCVWMIYGLWVTDSQSGFRAYSKRAIDLIDTKTARYEYDSEVIREISHHQLNFAEIPIEVRYTEYSMSKKNKMNLANGAKVLIKMLIS